MRCLCRLVRAFPAPCYLFFFVFIWLVRASFSTSYLLFFFSGDDCFNGAQWLGVRVRGGGGGATLGAWVMPLAGSRGSGMAHVGVLPTLFMSVFIVIIFLCHHSLTTAAATLLSCFDLFCC